MRRRLACVAAWLIWAAAAPASAQTAGSEAEPRDAAGIQRDEAKARYEQGVIAYKNGRFKDAVDLFLEADRLAPSAPLSFNIARAYEKLGDDAGALRWYRDYLRRAPDAPNAADVTALVRHFEGVLAKKGVQQLTVRSSPEGATVTIDDRPVGVTPWTGELAPGAHRISLSLRGFAETAQDVELPSDRAVDVAVRLVPAPEPAPSTVPAQSSQPSPTTSSVPAQVPAKDQPEQRGSRFGVWPWIGIGVGAAALGGALAFEMSRRSAESEAEREPTQIGYKDKLDTMESRQTTARVLGVVGGAFVVAGGVLLVLDLSGGSSGPKISAGCDPYGCGARAAGSF